jgi:hypothetical protein
MPKKPVSLTLDDANLLWLRGRARVSAGGNLSEAVDQIITLARSGAAGTKVPARPVVGTIDLGPEDPDLRMADARVRELFAAALAGPLEIAGRAPNPRQASSSGPQVLEPSGPQALRSPAPGTRKGRPRG